MTSKTTQRRAIRKRKKHAHRANLKTDLKRMAKNHEVTFPTVQTPQ